jgi:hypothetical protein
VKTLLLSTLLSIALTGSAARAQSPATLPTPLPQPFSPNGVLRPIIPFQPAVPVPNTRPLNVVPLPTPAPNLTIAPLKTPSNDVAFQSQNLLKQVPMHRRWPVLQPRDGAKPASGGGGGTAAGGARAQAVSNTFGVPNIPPHRRPLGW